MTVAKGNWKNIQLTNLFRDAVVKGMCKLAATKQPPPGIPATDILLSYDSPTIDLTEEQFKELLTADDHIDCSAAAIIAKMPDDSRQKLNRDQRKHLHAEMCQKDAKNSFFRQSIFLVRKVYFSKL